MKYIITLLLLLSVFSCSHMRSGKYIMNERGEWEFVPSNVGIAHLFQDDHEQDYGIWDGDFLWPVPSARKISSGYGKRWGRYHYGIDIPGKKGNSVLAADEGVVVYADNKISGYGKMVIIAHGSGMKTVYAHNSENLVRKGQKVHRGEVIAKVGQTGKASGPHVHFEVRRYGAAQNPMKYFKTSRSLASR